MSGGRAARSKGRRGQQAFTRVLMERDWVVHELNAGKAVADFVATDPQGRTWCVEVKNTAGIPPGHMVQARGQAKKAQLPWLLANKLAGTSSWLVRRQGERPAVWHEQ